GFLGPGIGREEGQSGREQAKHPNPPHQSRAVHHSYLRQWGINEGGRPPPGGNARAEPGRICKLLSCNEVYLIVGGGALACWRGAGNFSLVGTPRDPGSERP